MKQIKSIHLTQLLVAAHLGFHKGVVRLIQRAAISELHLEALFSGYEEAIMLQSEHINRPFSLRHCQKLVFEAIQDITPIINYQAGLLQA